MTDADQAPPEGERPLTPTWLDVPFPPEAPTHWDNAQPAAVAWQAGWETGYLRCLESARVAAPAPPIKPLTPEQAEAIEAEIRRAEADPSVDKHALRLLMQSAMPCGHSYGELMTCDSPPFGCAACQAPLRAPCRTGPKDPA